jgi:mannose-6-phosphate isomerase-like protein (cupin superfamily)
VSEGSWLGHEADRAWEYDPGREGQPDALRWRVLVSRELTPSRGLAMGTMEVPPGAELAPHHHHPLETYYIAGGSAEVYDGERWVPVEKGHVAYWPEDHPHGIRNRGEGVCTVVWTFPTDSYYEIEYIDE